MSGGFTKLFSSIVTSSIWVEDHPTVRVWIGMLALADAHGVVEGSIPGLANVCRVTPDECKAAIEILSSLDAFSRNPENEGRRIEPHPGGWRILNYLNYRARGQDKDGSRADYMRRYRSRLKTVTCNSEQLRVIQKQKQKQKQKTDKEKNTVAFSDGFLALWTEYPNRNGRKSGKRQAWKEWKEISPDDSLQALMVERLRAQKAHRENLTSRGEFVPEFPDLCRWLKHRRWEDEVREVKPSW